MIKQMRVFCYQLLVVTFTAIVLIVITPLGILKAENLIVNGDFSSGLSSWDQSSLSGPFSVTVLSSSVCASFHTTQAAAFNVYSGRRSALEQSVVIPASSTATLSMKVWGQYQATTAFIYIVDSNSVKNQLDQFVATPMITSYTFPGPTFDCSGNSFETKSYDVSAYAGQTVKVRIEATSSGNDGTFAIFDDVTLDVVTSGTGGGGNGGGSGKKPSAVRIICNRSGDLLSATCAATVGDAGGPPLITPTGLVNFQSKEDAPEFGASCQLQQTPFSPGVSSCSVSYTPPVGFPIGAAFPLDALYEGDTNFEASATDHQLLVATCIGDSSSPCSGGVGLDFGSEALGLINDALALIFSCAPVSKAARASTLPGKTEAANSCSLDSELELNLAEELDEFDSTEWRAMAEEISKKDAANDPVLREIKKIGELEDAALQAQLQNTLEIAKKLSAANKEYYRKKTIKESLRATSLQATLVMAKTSVPKIIIPLAKSKSSIKGGTEKTLSLKLDSRARKIMNVIRASGQGSLNLTLKANIKAAGKGSKKKKFALTKAMGLY